MNDPEPPPPMSQVTQVLNAVEAGDEQAASRLFALVYDELRRLAAAQLVINQREQPARCLLVASLYGVQNLCHLAHRRRR